MFRVGRLVYRAITKLNGNELFIERSVCSIYLCSLVLCRTSEYARDKNHHTLQHETGILANNHRRRKRWKVETERLLHGLWHGVKMPVNLIKRESSKKLSPQVTREFSSDVMRFPKEIGLIRDGRSTCVMH